ncbi:MAG: hypothetical protein K8R87_02045 [Verrucomicrobia bacterium]|nr:hypothetical protein [Verrucomicrobiota bacterium]
MKSICIRLLCCAALAAGLVSCVDVPSYSNHGGGYNHGYNQGYYGGGYNQNYNGGGYNQGYNQGYYQGHAQGHNHQQQQHHETHCYCSHKSCGCKPGHPKGGCYCDKGAHRH